MKDIVTQGYFKFWCQKILPLTYDNSLSYYECLCKVTDHLNKVIENNNNLIENFNELVTLFNELKSYVDNYFDNLDVQDEINKKLDQMVADGTFDKILSDLLFNEVYEKIYNVQYWSEPPEYLEAYRKEVVNNAVSYLLYCYASDSVVNNQIPKFNQVCWEYNTNLGYMGLMGRYLKFQYTDKQDTADGQLPIAYADCAVFTSLINKCISFFDSPYYYAFNTANPNIKTLFRKSMESGTIESKPYTYDLLNNYNTNTMAYIQNKCGIGLIKNSYFKRGDVVAEYFNTDNLETGDMVYRGISGNSYFNGIDHCGTFIKSLDELNNANGVPNGTTFKTFNNHTSNIGYILEFTGATADNYRNCLRISAFEDWAENRNVDWVAVYSAKPISCTLTSNKAYSELTSEICCYDFKCRVLQERTEEGGYKISEVIGTQSGGLIIPEGSDLNSFTYNGNFRCGSTSLYNTLTNPPPNGAYKNFTLVCLGFNLAGTYGTQLAYGISVNNYQYQCMRTCVNGKWSPWCEVNTLNDSSANIGVKSAAYGFVNVNNIPSGQYRDVNITYDFPFANKPFVLVNKVALPNTTIVANDIVYASVISGSETTSGFTLRVYNPRQSTASGSFMWFAVFSYMNRTINSNP